MAKKTFSRLIYLLIVILNVYASSATAAGDRNCIDCCIIEYCRLRGAPIEEQHFDKVVLSCGFELYAPSRNLRECTKLLSALGQSVSAVELNLTQRLSIPAVSIVYLPPLFDKSTVGHAAILTSDSNSRFSMYDPANSKATVRQGVETVIILTSTYDSWNLFFQRLLNSLHHVSFAILLLLLFALAMKAKHPTIRRATRVASTLVVVVLMGGCQGLSQSDISVESGEVFDFGIIEVTDDRTVTKHIYKLTNRGKAVHKILVGQASCGCFVDNAAWREKDVLPGESVEFPVALAIGQKWGPVRERLSVLIDGIDKGSLNLELTGFVLRQPTPRRVELHLQSFPHERTMDAIEIIQLLPKGHVSPKLVKYDMACEPKGVLSLGECAITESQIDGAKKVKWSIPVTMELPHDLTEVSGIAKLSWEFNQIEVTVIGRKCGPIEVPSLILLPQLLHGKKHVETIPVKIYGKPEQIQFSCSSSDLSASVLADQSALRLVYEPNKIGEFSHEVRCYSLNGETIFKVEGAVE